MKHPNTRKIAFLNILGSFGYIMCLFQWLWMLIILLPSMIKSPVFQFFLANTAPEQPPVVEASAPVAAGDVPVIVTVLALIIGVAIVVGAAYIIIVKFPRSVAKTGETVTHTAAKIITPVITKHSHLPAKQKREIPALIIVITKSLLVLLPFVLLLFARDANIAISFYLVMFIGVVLFSWSFVVFAFQLLLSKFFAIDYKTIR